MPKPDLTVCDVYDDLVPDEHVLICLKVIRTIRNLMLGPEVFDVDTAVLLSHAHARIVEISERCYVEG